MIIYLIKSLFKSSKLFFIIVFYNVFIFSNLTKSILNDVYTALKEKGYNPINQLVGYLISGDPSYITSYNGARALLRKLERDEILEEVIKSYLDIK